MMNWLQVWEFVVIFFDLVVDPLHHVSLHAEGYAIHPSCISIGRVWWIGCQGLEFVVIYFVDVVTWIPVRCLFDHVGLMGKTDLMVLKEKYSLVMDATDEIRMCQCTIYL